MFLKYSLSHVEFVDMFDHRFHWAYTFDLFSVPMYENVYETGITFPRFNITHSIPSIKWLME